MMRKIFGIKSISHLIYGLLMLAPILAIGVKCAYVIINKNAKDSYYGETINEIKYVDVENYTLNNKYHFQNDGYSTIFSSASYVYVSDVKNYVFPTTSTAMQNALDENALYRIEFTNYNSQPLFKFYREDNLSSSVQNFSGSDKFQFDFILLSYNTDTTILNNFVKSIEYNKNSYLDNVFYYAIDEIIQDNNFGKINFTGWFDNMMLDNNIQINQTYIHLFNWYLNYTLFISCAYILWLVLMWFVTFARKLLDRGMNYDW